MSVFVYVSSTSCFLVISANPAKSHFAALYYQRLRWIHFSRFIRNAWAASHVCTNTAVVGSRFTGDSVLVDFFCVKVFDQLYSADRVTRLFSVLQRHRQGQ